MRKITTYNDPTFSGTKNSNIVYPRKAGRANVNSTRALGTKNLEDKVAGMDTEGFDASALNDLVPYASNIVNSFRKLPTPKQAGFEDTISPNLVNLDAARNNIDVDRRNLDRETDYRITNPAVAQALKASTLGRVIDGKNSLAMTEANQNAQIKNQTSQFNQGVTARNLGRKQTYLDNLTARQIEGQNLQADNLADVGDKYQMQQKDKNLMDLEARKLATLAKNSDNGSFGRNLSSNQIEEIRKLNPTLTDAELKEKYGFRYGGKIKRFRNYFKQY